MGNKSVLIFGVGALQRSIIERCKAQGIFTVGIDPCPEAECKDCVDAFEVVSGHDYESTLKIADNYNISGVLTAATDKPLVMMARIAAALNLPFYSEEAAMISTDKLLMKKKFQEFSVPCAKGFLLNGISSLDNYSFEYPVIVKPRDNSGSRGVIYCQNEAEVRNAWTEALQYTQKTSILVEEFIDGQEYSIESVHYKGKTHVIQFTEKKTTDFPYNVELEHLQPANISEEIKDVIRSIVGKIAIALGFDNCCSHTELKISNRGITVIETSPRLGGDYITSTLVPLSTGINMEDILIKMAIGDTLMKEDFNPKVNLCSGVVFFDLPQGEVIKIDDLDEIRQIEGIQSFSFDLHTGDIVNKITSSLNRYGQAIFQESSRECLLSSFDKCRQILDEKIIVK